ncbi:MAG: hypothetical protein ACYTG0_10505 [Planctomycetota bacterium]
MRFWQWMCVATLLAVVITGCGESEDQGDDPATTGPGTQSRQPQSARADEAPPPDTSQPAGAVAVFLDALRKGDDQSVLGMYTARAREEMLQLGDEKDVFAPKASDTAQFTVGAVESQSPDLAYVACTWTDLDQDGNPHTLDLAWAVRRESAGWRVAGMGATTIEGEPPVLLDFENMEETIREVNRLRQEFHQPDREGVQAQRDVAPDDATRR